MSSSQGQETSSVPSRNIVKKAYLITYSNANTSVFDREKFSSAIVQSFQSATRSVVLHWSCCMEQHQNGSYRFHIAVLLDIAQRRMKVKNASKTITIS